MDSNEERDHDFKRELWDQDHCADCRERAENCTCVYPPLFSAFGFEEEEEE